MGTKPKHVCSAAEGQGRDLTGRVGCGRGVAVSCKSGGGPAVEHDRANHGRLADGHESAAPKRIHRRLHL